MLVHGRPRLHRSREGMARWTAGRLPPMLMDPETGKIGILDNERAARSRTRATPLRRPVGRSLTLPACPSGADRIARGFGVATQWLRRASIACAVAMALLCSGALANDPIRHALSLIAQERYEEARDLLDPLLEREPNAPGVRLLHGVLQAREGSYAEAIAIFEGLRHDYPDMIEAHNNLAVLYAGFGQLDDARDALIAALELRPDDVVYTNLGDVYMQLAERAYLRARELRAADPAAPEGSEELDTASAPPAEPLESLTATATEVGEREPVPEPQEPASAEVPTPVSADASGEDCVRTGMFEDRVSADEAAAWMRAQGVEAAEVHREEHEAIKNHRVYVPAASTREAAVAMVRELRRLGVSDVGVIAEGPLANAVSLGLFRSESNMRRRVAEIEKLGYSVISQANRAAVEAFAIEAQVGGDRAAFDAAWATTFPGQPIRAVDCAPPN